MVTIDWVSLGIGAGVVFIMLVIPLVLGLLSYKKKPKYDLHNLIKIVQEAGEHTKEAYTRLQELGKAFNDMQGAKKE